MSLNCLASLVHAVGRIMGRRQVCGVHLVIVDKAEYHLFMIILSSLRRAIKIK